MRKDQIMKSAILMTSVAVAALAAPAWAGPDRFEQGCRYGVSAAPCVQQNLTNHGGKPRQSGPNGGLSGGALGGFGNTAAVSRTSQSNSDDSLSDEVGDTANEAGNAINHTANEAGDTIGHAADEAGDSIGHAANEAGDAF
jgi:hypothetical protein